MPDLEQRTIDELKLKLERKISLVDGYHSPIFLAAGGSAAVFKVETPTGPRAYKVFDPRFINEAEGSKERHRLSLQERLINHDCKTLVQTYSIELAEGTAFVEMEFIEWPQLKKVLRDIPDDSIQLLIIQLINAVKYLESLSIVHRDIKPENIHISPDFKKLKLLDLGVVREFNPGPDVEETDHGNLRVFLATAQYSAPEYLFRLDAPSENLWRALNIYQVGAVLHDMIIKEPIFQAEIDTGNRWLVAKSVLLKRPQFIDGNPGRLARLKSIASKCLTKDMDTRLQIVSWEDFSDIPKESLTSLRECLSSRGTSSEQRLAREIEFYREEFKELLFKKIRENLISVCKTDLPFSFSNSIENQKHIIELDFPLEKEIHLVVRIIFDWQHGVYNKNTNILASCHLTFINECHDVGGMSKQTICSCNIDDVNIENESYLICSFIADKTVFAIDLVASSAVEMMPKLNGFDLTNNK